jgi:hypothetical protein
MRILSAFTTPPAMAPNREADDSSLKSAVLASCRKSLNVNIPMLARMTTTAFVLNHESVMKEVECIPA